MDNLTNLYIYTFHKNKSVVWKLIQTMLNHRDKINFKEL